MEERVEDLYSNKKGVSLKEAIFMFFVNASQQFSFSML